MKRIEELKTKKLLPRIYEISTPEPNFTRSTSTDLTPRAEDRQTVESIVRHTNDERMATHVLTGKVHLVETVSLHVFRCRRTASKHHSIFDFRY